MARREPKSESLAHRKAPLRAFAQVLLRSALNPLHLSIAAGSAGASWFLDLWPLAALGGATFVALVASDVVNPEFWKRALNQPAIEAGDAWALDTVADPALRARCVEVWQARAELLQVSKDHPDVAELLAGVLTGAEQLDDRAKSVAGRADHLARYLSRTNVRAIHTELEQLRTRIQASENAEAREQYAKIVSTREEQLAAINDIAAGLERAHAQLLRIRATFEGLSARILRLSALDADARSAATGGMNEEVDEVHRDLEAFEEVLRELNPVGTNA